MLWVALTFVALVLLGMPLAFALGIAGAVFFFQQPELPATIPLQLAITQTQSFALLAIPLFIIAGHLMNHSGITERLLALAVALTGRLRGGLAQVSLALSAMMGGVSGSCIADAAMQARVLGPEMVQRGYPRGFVAAVLSYGSLLTPIIPPGIGFILYGTVGQVSIGRLFAAGILPALLLWAAMALAISFAARRRGIAAERQQRASARELLRALGRSAWAVLFPVWLIAGLRLGVFTPSEIGAFAVVYALAVGAIAHRSLGAASAYQALRGSLSDIGGVMFLIALSAIFGYGIVVERLPETISAAMLELTRSPYLVLALIVASLLIAGTVIDGAILIVMLTPIFLPLVQDLGVDPVHFGVIFVIAATVSNFTPPVGSAMYTVCSILRCNVAAYSRESVPLLVAVAAVTLLLIALPGAVLWLPNLLFGG